MIWALRHWKLVLGGLVISLVVVSVARHLHEHTRLAAQNATLTASNIALRTQAEAFEEARAAHRGHLERAEQRARESEALLSELQNMEGADAPVSDYLRSAGERLWGQ